MSDAMRGDEALAWGAQAAGVRVVTGYPGSPATGVFDALLARTAAGADCDIAWAANEKVAMEIATGASIGGARSLVVLKSVGLNVALDPLATMAYTGCHKGLVILLGEDPGGWGSQNEQDSRWAARLAEVPLVEPTDVTSAAALMAQAFAWSEALSLPVIVRITRAMAQAEGRPEPPWTLPPPKGGFLRKRNRWITLPQVVVRRHRTLHRRLREARAMFEASPYDVSEGSSPTGIVAVGFTYQKVVGALGEALARHRVLRLASAYPLPEESLALWLEGIDRAVVLEEGGPFVEEALAALAQHHALPVRILGRHNRHVPEEGELTAADIVRAIAGLEGSTAEDDRPAVDRGPSPVPLCDECLYRPAIESLLRAMQSAGGRERHLVVGETGCMVRANLAPYELFDVKLSLGSSLGLALGLAAAQRDRKVVALLGDSSLYHSDLNALPQAVQRDARLLAIVLDNGTTALTGGQPYPGTPSDERGRSRVPVDMATMLRGFGAKVRVCEARESEALDEALAEGLGHDGFGVVVVQCPCPRHLPGPSSP